jgi:hypothetical protein
MELDEWLSAFVRSNPATETKVREVQKYLSDEMIFTVEDLQGYAKTACWESDKHIPSGLKVDFLRKFGEKPVEEKYPTQSASRPAPVKTLADQKSVGLLLSVCLHLSRYKLK